MQLSGIEAIIVPIVNVLTGVFKLYGINSKLLPMIALVIGAGMGLALQPDVVGLVEGIAAAWVSMGNYSIIKTMAKA